MNKTVYATSALWASIASATLLVLFFALVTAISGKSYAQEQFSLFWPYLVSLAAGFGIQVGMYIYLRQMTRRAAGKTVAVTGTTSTLSMLTCCAHYVANILPVIGVTGAMAFIAQYQIEFFWAGLAANAIGILYVLSKVLKYRKEAL